jgi:murein DD-endopeptidase MepM/ murein hydrolase activator NlpD
MHYCTSGRLLLPVLTVLFLLSSSLGSAEVVGSEARSLRRSGIIKNCKKGGGFERQKKACTVLPQSNGDIQGANCGSPHKGVDYPRADRGVAAPPIYNLHPGKVVFAGFRRDYGNRIVIDEGHGKFTTYNHLSSFAVAKSGKTLPAGTILGVMGNTGSSSGTHLHLEFVSNGKYVNPGTEYLKYCN